MGEVVEVWKEFHDNNITKGVDLLNFIPDSEKFFLDFELKNPFIFQIYF